MSLMSEAARPKGGNGAGRFVNLAHALPAGAFAAIAGGRGPGGFVAPIVKLRVTNRPALGVLRGLPQVSTWSPELTCSGRSGAALG